MHHWVTEAAAVQDFNWLQPSTKVTQVPTSVVQAMAAKAPASSPTSQGVRDFVNQAGFQDSPGSTQQAGSAANTNSQQQQQGRRLAEVLSEPTRLPNVHDTFQFATSSPCLSLVQSTVPVSGAHFHIMQWQRRVSPSWSNAMRQPLYVFMHSACRSECMCFHEGQGPAVSSPPASAQRPGPGQDPSVAARLTNAFGSSATALLRAGGTNFLQAAPTPVPGVTPAASDMIQLLGPAVSNVADTAAAPAPAPSGARMGRATSIDGEAAAGSAHAPATSMESEVATHATAPAVAPSAAAAALAARGAQLQGPRPPFQDALDAVAGLPGALGFLPRLPGMPGSSTTLQAQDGAQGSSEAGQAGAAGPMPLPPGMGRRR